MFRRAICHVDMPQFSQLAVMPAGDTVSHPAREPDQAVGVTPGDGKTDDVHRNPRTKEHLWEG